jgi:hypothetical protein
MIRQVTSTSFSKPCRSAGEGYVVISFALPVTRQAGKNYATNDKFKGEGNEKSLFAIAVDAFNLRRHALPEWLISS